MSDIEMIFRLMAAILFCWMALLIMLGQLQAFLVYSGRSLYTSVRSVIWVFTFGRVRMRPMAKSMHSHSLNRAKRLQYLWEDWRAGDIAQVSADEVDIQGDAAVKWSSSGDRPHVLAIPEESFRHLGADEDLPPVLNRPIGKEDDLPPVLNKPVIKKQDLHKEDDHLPSLGAEEPAEDRKPVSKPEPVREAQKESQADEDEPPSLF